MTTSNGTQTFDEDFLKRIRENYAWKNISGSEQIPWSEKLIEANADHLDWFELSGNKNIPWTNDLIEKYKSRIDWNELSRAVSYVFGRGSKAINWDLIQNYESFWNWHLLSENIGHITEEKLTKYAGKWDWKQLIDNRHLNWSFELYWKFRQYIPTGNLEDFTRSSLWSDLVAIEEKMITGKILEGTIVGEKVKID